MYRLMLYWLWKIRYIFVLLFQHDLNRRSNISIVAPYTQCIKTFQKLLFSTMCSELQWHQQGWVQLIGNHIRKLFIGSIILLRRGWESDNVLERELRMFTWIFRVWIGTGQIFQRNLSDVYGSISIWWKMTFVWWQPQWFGGHIHERYFGDASLKDNNVVLSSFTFMD